MLRNPKHTKFTHGDTPHVRPKRFPLLNSDRQMELSDHVSDTKLAQLVQLVENYPSPSFL